MRIVSINVHYQDGLGYQDYYLGRAFIEAGHEVIFVASDWHFKFPNYNTTVKHIIGERFTGAGIFRTEFGAPLHRLKTRNILGKLRMIGLKEKLAELRPDIIFCHGVFNLYSLSVANYGLQNKVPVIFDDHTTSNVRNNKWYIQPFYLLFRKIATGNITKAATKVVAISDSVLEYLRKDLGFKEKLQTISLGADTDIFYKDDKEREDLRNQLAISEDTILITYTGKIYGGKLLDQIPKSLKMIDLREKKVCLLFVGSVAAEYQEEFENILKDPAFRCIYHKSVTPPELRKYYNASDICCWPAHATGSTVDASACGCPIICNVMLSERFSHGNGFGVEEGNTLQLKEALEQLIFNQDLRKKMGAAGIDFVQKKLSWNAISKEFLS